MRLIVLLAVLLGSTTRLLATTPVIDRLTDEELWQQSNLIAVVLIESGEFDREKYSYQVSASVVANLKGNGGEQIKFSDSFPWQYPERLGGYYLVHLAAAEKGYLTVETGSSVIELRAVDPAYPAEVKKLAVEKGAPENSIISYKKHLWVISECLDGGMACNQLIPVVKQAFNKQRQSDA